MGKINNILTVIILANSMACSNSQNTKLNAESNSAVVISYKNVEFKSQEVTLRGRLYLPDDKSEKRPVVIMAHGFTTTINGMTADKYAEKFHEAGFAVLLYDHQNFGISDGEPRQEINFWVQSRGYIDGIDFVHTQPEIDTTRIAIWGASLSALEAFLVGSVDERVKAIINQIPAYGDNFPTEDKDSQLYNLAKETVLTEKILDLPHKVTEQMPIVSSDQLGTSSALSEITAYRWFIEYGGRFGTNWENVVSFSTIEVPDDFNLVQFADQLKAPILMIVATNDEMNGANPKVTQYVYNNITQPKEWVDIDGGHFGLLYYPSPLFDKSSKAQIDFLNKYLK
jgi:cephalosporin-C deacetylase-like acetyl esterase